MPGGDKAYGIACPATLDLAWQEIDTAAGPFLAAETHGMALMSWFVLKVTSQNLFIRSILDVLVRKINSRGALLQITLTHSAQTSRHCFLPVTSNWLIAGDTGQAMLLRNTDCEASQHLPEALVRPAAKSKSRPKHPRPPLRPGLWLCKAQASAM